MKKNEVKVGHFYRAKVGANITTVRVDDIKDVGRRSTTSRNYPSMTRYHVTNMKTGKEIVFRSAAKFREECDAKGRTNRDKAMMEAFGCPDPDADLLKENPCADVTVDNDLLPPYIDGKPTGRTLTRNEAEKRPDPPNTDSGLNGNGPTSDTTQVQDGPHSALKSEMESASVQYVLSSCLYEKEGRDFLNHQVRNDEPGFYTLSSSPQWERYDSIRGRTIDKVDWDKLIDQFSKPLKLTVVKPEDIPLHTEPGICAGLEPLFYPEYRRRLVDDGLMPKFEEAFVRPVDCSGNKDEVHTPLEMMRLIRNVANTILPSNRRMS